MALGCLVKCRRSFPVSGEVEDGTNRNEASACGKSGKFHSSPAKGSSTAGNSRGVFGESSLRCSMFLLQCSMFKEVGMANAIGLACPVHFKIGDGSHCRAAKAKQH